ncbi:MAG: hypothetical protein CMD92_03675 [Gammaproteobacteria bacterium]|nr:hypothetical protein [Gammaproteobacteria bacterium]|tara:strand:+ start:9408 stop:10784 length:1377 start_codon:yes stop_codon:yes gene_type:complete
MGLIGGPTGAKAVFLDKFAGAFAYVKRLDDVRKLVGVSRAHTLAVLDGNVMMNAIPKEVDTFHGYVRVLAYQLNEAIQAAAHVVVVFDDPKAITPAKADEQQRRDQLRQARVPLCSEDLVATIFDDDYHTNDLLANGCNAKLLMEFRKARPRFYDAVCTELLRKFRNEMTGDGKWSLTFDGVDRRGGERGIGVPREAGTLSSDDAFWQPLLTRSEPIGEGDLKLTDVTQRVHDASRIEGTPVHGVLLNLVTTIDTDSFVIELLQQNRRERRTEEADRDELTVLCLKERARKRKGDDFVTDAHYTCCDMQAFHELVLDYFYGTRHLTAEMKAQQPAALALLAAALAFCGCDFVDVKGYRFDLALPVVRQMARTRPKDLNAMARLFETERFGKIQALTALQTFILDYCKSLEGVPRMKKVKENASSLCEQQLYRVLWTCSYWHQQELKDCTQWGFSSLCG